MEKLKEKAPPFFETTQITCEEVKDYEYFKNDPLLEVLAETQYFQALENKTQVTQRFLCEENVSTKLSHTLQVMKLSEGIAETKGADKEAVLRIAAFHDCGQTPFGAIGERVMKDILVNMNERGTILGDMLGEKERTKFLKYKNFRHELMSATIFEKIVRENALESKNNIIVLEGILNHGGRMLKSGSKEGKIVGLADTISYLVQDIKDAQKVGFRLDFPETLGNTPEEILKTISLDILKNNDINKDSIMSENAIQELKILKKYMYENFYNSEDLKILDIMLGNTLQGVFMNWCSEIYELRDEIEDGLDIDDAYEYYRDFFNLQEEQSLRLMLNFDESLMQFISLSDDDILERSEFQTREQLKMRAESYKKFHIIKQYGKDQ